MTKNIYKLIKLKLKENSNTSISPISFFTLLELLTKGTKGKLHNEFSNWIGKEEEGAQKKIISLTQSLHKGNFEIRNSIQHSKLLKVKEDFLSRISPEILPQIIYKDFQDQATHFEIRNKTRVKQKWQNTFKDIDSKSGIFYLANGKLIESYFMYQSNIDGGNKVEYLNNEIFHSIRIPLEDKDFGFEIYLPHEKGQLHKLHGSLTFEKILSLNNEFGKIECLEAILPKFHFDSNLSLKEYAKLLNIDFVFENTKDFEVLFNAPDVLFLKDIIQINSIEVDTEGIEASSESIAFGGIGSVAREPNKFLLFEANHPFIFILRHLKTNTILQIGQFCTPNKVSEEYQFVTNNEKLNNAILKEEIRRLRTYAFNFSVRNMIYLGLTSLNSIINKFDYEVIQLNTWFKDVINLISKDLPSDGAEIKKLDFWSYENMTGFPYDSTYLLEKDYISFQKEFPEISKIVESICSLINNLVYEIEDNFLFNTYMIDSLTVFMSELVKYNLALPEINNFMDNKDKTEKIIGKKVNLELRLINRLMK